MRKLFALVATMAMVLSMFAGIAFAEGTYSVVFAEGSSAEAGANSKLVFTIADDTAQSFSVDFGATGFVPIGAATWTNGTGVVSNIVGNQITVYRSNADSAATITVPVRNPLVAGYILDGAGFAVTTDGTATDAVTTGNADLYVLYTVTPSVKTAIAGTTSAVTFTVTEAGKVVTSALNYWVEDGAGRPVAAGSTSNGVFTAYIPFSIPSDEFATSYYVIVENDADANLCGFADIPVLYTLTYNGIENIKYLDAATITGRLTNAAGQGMGGVTIYLDNKTAGSEVAYAVTAADGTYAMTAVFADAAEYALVVADQEYKTFTVAGLGLDVTASPTSVTKTLGTTNMTFTVKYGTTTATGAEIRILNPDGTVRQDWTSTLTWTAPVDLATGTYKVEARWEAAPVTNNVYDRTGSTTFSVVSPAKVNVSYSGSSVDGDGKLIVGPNGVIVTIRDINGAGLKADPAAGEIKKVVATVKGVISEEITFDSTKDAFADGAKTQIALPFFVEMGGTVTVSGTVTFGDGSVETFSKTFTTNGWVITTNKVIGTVGDVVTLDAKVTTIDGVPVNNAIVTWGAIGFDSFLTTKNADGTWTNATDEVAVNGTVTNINNGDYKVQAKLAHADDVYVYVYNSSMQVKAVLPASISGQTYYTVAPGANSVLATLNGQTLKVIITDSNGSKVTNLQQLDVTGCGVNLTIANAVMFDANSDSIVDGYQFTVAPTTTGTITVKAGTEQGNKIGTATVAVVAPNVTINLGAAVTESINEKLNVSVNDLLANGNARTVTLKIDPVAAFMTLKTDAATPVLVSPDAAQDYYTIAAASEHKYIINAWDDATNTTTVPVVDVYGSYNGTDFVKVGTLAVTPMTVELSTETIYVGGVNKIEATVVDAHGVAMNNRAVALAGSFGSTDAEGKVTLHVTPSSTGTSQLTVATDRPDVFVTKTVTMTADNVKPELDLSATPTEVETNKVTLKGSFSDNLKVTAIYVNGQSIPFISEAGEFEHDVTLSLGANTFTVFAFDAAGNGVKETITVTYAPAAPKAVTLQGTSVQRKGENLFVEIRKFEDLGAKLTWNGTTKTATFTYGTQTVSVTIGSTTATVNGVAKTMPAAPFLSNGRTLVPTRFISEALGWDVKWVPGDIVTITLP